MSAPARRPAGKASSTKASAKPLPRPAKPSATRASSAPTPAEDGGFTVLVQALAALIASFAPNVKTAPARTLLAALEHVLNIARRFEAAPSGSAQLADYFMEPTEEHGGMGGLSVSTVRTWVPEPQTPEQLRAEADALTEKATADLAHTAEVLRRLGKMSPHAAQLAAGLRALLSPPALAPAQRRFASHLLDVLALQGELVDGLAAAQEDAAALRLKLVEKPSPGEMWDAIAEVEDAIQNMRSLAWQLGDRINYGAEEITGRAARSGALGCAVDLALLLRAGNENKADADAEVIERAHRAWTAE